MCVLYCSVMRRISAAEAAALKRDESLSSDVSAYSLVTTTVVGALRICRATESVRPLAHARTSAGLLDHSDGVGPHDTAQT